MALSKAAKEALAEQYREHIAGAPHAFLVGFKGISVGQVDQLRRSIRQTGGHYRVVKNRIARRAVVEGGLHELHGHFRGMTAVAYSNDDPVGLAKALTDFAKANPVLEFKAGLVDGQPVAGDSVQAIASLPSRDELIAKLLYLLQSPITRFVRGLAAIPRQFVVVLDQVRQQRES